MDKNVKQEKLKMWRENLKQLEKELGQIMVKKGEAAREGDLRENAAYQLASEDADTWRVRIDQVKKLIADLENS